MRASELLGAPVADSSGRRIGRVRDLRLAREDRTWRVTTIVICGDDWLARIAHAWGFAEGRATGPWLLRVLTSSGSRRSRTVATEEVAEWEPGQVRLR